MNARFLIIAAAALGSVTGARAEPAQPARETPQAATPAPRLLLASADEASARPSPDQQATPATKRPRIARVTTCRCGGADVQADEAQ